MEIKLSKVQRDKLDALVARKQLLQDEISRIDQQLRDAVELVADFNGADLNDIEDVEIRDDVLILSMREPDEGEVAP